MLCYLTVPTLKSIGGEPLLDFTLCGLCFKNIVPTMTYFGRLLRISSFRVLQIRCTSPLLTLLYDTSIIKIKAGAFGRLPFWKQIHFMLISWLLKGCSIKTTRNEREGGLLVGKASLKRIAYPCLT